MSQPKRKWWGTAKPSAPEQPAVAVNISTSYEEPVGAIEARVTTPEKTPGKPIAWLPARRGNIVVTQDKALELSACFACVRVISEDIAKLPWNVFARSGNARQKLDNSPIYRLLNSRPNPEMGSFAFRETITAHALTWGGGYAEIERDLGGRPRALWLLDPSRVNVVRGPDGSQWFEVTQQSREKVYLSPDDVFHLHGLGFDGLTGYSMVGLAAQTLGFGIAAEEHGASFYGNNTTAGLSLKTDAVLNEEGFERLKKQVAEKKGSARAYEGFILEQGMDFANPNMSQVDAQYTETQTQIVQAIARWWRVPPHKIGDLSRAHFTNIEHQSIDYVTDTLMPWVKRLEEEADWKLIGNRSQASYTKIAVQALLRGDASSRGAWYKEMVQLGIYSQNEVRALEDMDPIGPEGDVHWMQSQFAPIKNLAAAPVEQPTQTAAEKMVRTAAAKLMESQLRKAADVKEKSRADFAQWSITQAENTRGRVVKTIAELEPIIKAAYGLVIDVEQAATAYQLAENKELMAFHAGIEPDANNAAAALLEVLV